MDTIDVDRGIPIPKTANSTQRTLYPFRDMEYGDSFFIKVLSPSKSKLQSVRASAYAAGLFFVRKYAAYRGASIVTRKVHEKGDVGIRVWLVSPEDRHE